LRAMWARLEVVPMGWGYGPSPNKMGRSEGVISNTRTFVCSTGQQFFSPRAPPHFCIYIYIHTYTYIHPRVYNRIGPNWWWEIFQLEDFPAGHIRLAEGFPPPADGGVYVVWGDGSYENHHV
jgi:hypothetical protein